MSSDHKCLVAHLRSCVERYGVFELFVDEFYGSLHNELHKLLIEIFRCLLNDLPEVSEPRDCICSRQEFYDAHIMTFCSDIDVDFTSILQGRTRVEKSVVSLTPFARDVAMRFLFGHASSSLASVVLTRIDIRVVTPDSLHSKGQNDLTGYFLHDVPESYFSVPSDLAFTSIAASRCCLCSKDSLLNSSSHFLVSPSSISSAYKTKCLKEAEIASRVPLGVFVSPDEKKVTIKLPSVCMNTLLYTNRQMLCCSFNPSGTTVAAGFGDSSARCWRFNAGGANKTDISSFLLSGSEFRGHGAPIYGTSLNSDGSWLATASSDGTARLWSVETSRCVTKYEGKSVYEPLWNVQFCPSDGYFATGSHDRTARIWAMNNTMNAARIFIGHSGDVTMVQFHPNTSVIATGSTDNTVRLWDIGDGRCISVLKHTSTITCLAFHPTGQYLAVGMANGDVVLWNLKTSSPTIIYPASGERKSPVFSASFSADGMILATGEADCCVRLWDCSTESLIRCSEGDTELKKVLLLKSLDTKSTPVMALQFTRSNLLFSAGPWSKLQTSEQNLKVINDFSNWNKIITICCS